MSQERAPIREVFLFWGEDREAVTRNLRNLTARLGEESGMPAQRFHADEHPADDVVAVCQALSMGGTQLVILEDVSSYKAADVAPIVDYLSAPNPGTCLALTSVERPAPKLVEACQSAGLVRQFGPDPRAKLRDRQKWLSEHAAKELSRHGAQAGPAAVRELVTRVAVDRPDAHKSGVNALELTSAAGLLAAYAGSEPVTEAMVREIVPAHPDARAYLLADALLSGDGTAVHELLADLASGSDPANPMAIQSTLARHFQSLLAAQRLGPRPSPAEVSEATGVRGYPAQKLAEQAARVPPEVVSGLVARIASLELELRVSAFAQLGRTRDDGQRFVLEIAARDLLALTA